MMKIGGRKKIEKMHAASINANHISPFPHPSLLPCSSKAGVWMPGLAIQGGHQWTSQLLKTTDVTDARLAVLGPGFRV